jgi:hypothetical protein
MAIRDHNNKSKWFSTEFNSSLNSGYVCHHKIWLVRTYCISKRSPCSPSSYHTFQANYTQIHKTVSLLKEHCHFYVALLRIARNKTHDLSLMSLPRSYVSCQLLSVHKIWRCRVCTLGKLGQYWMQGKGKRQEITPHFLVHNYFSIKKNLRGFGPLANYADRAAADSWRSTNFCG